jgi:excisionase family DNA binding protein
MATAVLTSGTILVEEDLRKQARELVEEAHDRSFQEVSVSMDDGSVMVLSEDLSKFVSRVVEGLSRGPLSITMLPDELTTTVAAELLGISRPTLMKWIATGRISAHKAGSHARLLTDEVLAFRKTLRAQRQTAFDALRALDEEFGLDDVK